jgi:hypothetical protein
VRALAHAWLQLNGAFHAGQQHYKSSLIGPETPLGGEGEGLERGEKVKRTRPFRGPRCQG